MIKIFLSVKFEKKIKKTVIKEHLKYNNFDFN